MVNAAYFSSIGNGLHFNRAINADLQRYGLNQAPEREFYGEELNTQDKVVLVVLLHRKANSEHQDIQSLV